MKKYKYMHLFLLLSASATSLILQGDFAKIFEKIEIFEVKNSSENNMKII